MSPEEWAAEVLRREGERPGRFPANVVSRARELSGGGAGVVRLPEQKIEGDVPESGTVKFGRAAGRIEDAVNQLGEPIAAAGQAFANSMLAGVPNRVQPQTQQQQDVAARHPYATKAGDIAGMMASPLNKLTTALGGLARGAAPALEATRIGRIGAAAGEAGVGAGLYSGVRKAVEGGTLGESLTAAGEAAGPGALLGAGLQSTVGEGARALRQGLRGKFPEIATAEQGGAKLSVTKGIVPGPELSAAQRAAGERGLNPVDYQADLLVKPLQAHGREEMAGVKQAVRSDVRNFGATPTGQQGQPVTPLLDALTNEHLENVSRGTGRPLAGAKLEFLRENIDNLADVSFTEPGGQTPPGVLRMSHDEALRRGFNVEKAARDQLQNPAMAGQLDVLIKPAQYNAEETVQAVRNLDKQLAKQRQDGAPISTKVDAAAHSLVDNFEGLPALRAKHAQQVGGLQNELDMAGVSTRPFTGATEDKQLFNSIVGYGDRGAPAARDALSSQASKAGVERQLQLVAALRALERLKGEQLPPFQIRPSGRPGISLPKRAIAVRADPLLELLMGSPVPMARTFGEEESGR